MHEMIGAPLVGAIEAGGTKTVCAVGTGPDDIDRAMFPTGDHPARLFAAVTGWLSGQQGRRGRLQAIGIGSFGPIDLDAASPSYGRITSTPKPGWREADVAGAVRRAFPGIAIGLDTDVNVAALGERRWGQAVGLDDFIYITIGTGIGGGAMAGGKLVHGLTHPEMGHMALRRLPGDAFRGACPYHGDCWEGLCCGPAIAARTGMPAEVVPAEDPAWDLTTRYVAQALSNLVCILSPRRIILGGGVTRGGKLGTERFFGMIRSGLQSTLNHYIRSPAIETDIAQFIVPPRLGDNAGICGAIAAAQAALAGATPHAGVVRP